MQLDAEDESLRKWKESLGITAGGSTSAGGQTKVRREALGARMVNSGAGEKRLRVTLDRSQRLSEKNRRRGDSRVLKLPSHQS